MKHLAITALAFALTGCATRQAAPDWPSLYDARPVALVHEPSVVASPHAPASEIVRIEASNQYMVSGLWRWATPAEQAASSVIPKDAKTDLKGQQTPERSRYGRD